MASRSEEHEAPAPSERVISRASIVSRNTLQDNVIIIDNVVYDVTSWCEDHPGGAEVLLDNGGKDASRCFRDVGHSETAIEWRERYRIGVVPPDERWPEPPPAPRDQLAGEHNSLSALLGAAAPPLLLALISVLVYMYLL